MVGWVDGLVVDFSFLSTETARDTPMTSKTPPWTSSSRLSVVSSNPTEQIFELAAGGTCLHGLILMALDGASGGAQVLQGSP